MSDARRHVGFAEALSAGAEMNYGQEVAALSLLPPKQAQTEALQIIRQLAYTSWQDFYGTQQMRKRFDALWRMAFPEDGKGGKA